MSTANEIEYVEPKFDLHSVAKVTVLVGAIAAALSMATTGELGEVRSIGEFFLAIALNIFAIPIAYFDLGSYIGQSGLFDFPMWTWNVVVLMWLVVGFFFVNPVLKFVNLDRQAPVPTWPSVTSILVVPAATGIAVSYIVFDGAVETIGEVWMMVVFHIFLIPSYVLYDQFVYDLEVYLAVIGGLVVIGAGLGLLFRFYGREWVVRW